MGVPELQRSRNLQKSVSEREVERVQHQKRERARKVSGWRGIGGKAAAGMKGEAIEAAGVEREEKKSSKEESDKQRGRSRENEQGIH